MKLALSKKKGEVMINIDLDMGIHTMRMPHGIKKLFLDMIQSLDITQGNFKIHLGKNIRGVSQKGIKFIKVLPQYCAIWVKAQPSGKEGRHECTVYFPDIYKNDLGKFGELLQSKVGQEDWADEEVIPEEEIATTMDDVKATIIDVEHVENAIIRQQQYQAEALILSAEMLSLIVGDIFEKKGTGWIFKSALFKILNNLKLQYATNKLIGRLFHLGYLERDPENLEKRSRLTQSACLLINAPIPLDTGHKIVIGSSEDDLKVYNAVDFLRRSNAIYKKLLINQSKAFDELEKLKCADEKLQKRISRLAELMEVKMQENLVMINEKSLEIEKISQGITPRLIEASKRFEIIMADDLPPE